MPETFAKSPRTEAAQPAHVMPGNFSVTCTVSLESAVGASEGAGVDSGADAAPDSAGAEALGGVVCAWQPTSAVNTRLTAKDRLDIFSFSLNTKNLQMRIANQMRPA